MPGVLVMTTQPRVPEGTTYKQLRQLVADLRRQADEDAAAILDAALQLGERAPGHPWFIRNAAAIKRAEKR